MCERASSSTTVILSPSRNSVSLDIPKGLKTLLDDITKEVLHLSPESTQLYKVCADYLERRLIERDPISSTNNTPVRRPLRLVSTYTTDSDSGLDVGATPHHRGGGKIRPTKAQNNNNKWSHSLSIEGGRGEAVVVEDNNNIQERGLQQSTSDFEEEDCDFSKKFQRESILEIEATFQDSLLSRTELLLHESGTLSPLYPAPHTQNDLSGELKEIRLETLKRAKLPISVHLVGEKIPEVDPVLPLRLFINPDKPLSRRETGAQTSHSPPVQDDVVARVLLEHAEQELDESLANPRRTVNYLDLSKLGEEGETPASDEIWLPLGDEDKFLSSESDTFSLATDKLSHIANMSGEEPPTHSPMETEELSKYMGPIQEGLALTSQNVLDLTGKFQGLESTLRELCLTVEAIKSSSKFEKMDEVISKMNEKCLRCSKIEDGSNTESTKTRSIETTQITDQLREDNSLLRQDLQQYRERERRLLDRLDGLEQRLIGVNLTQVSSPPSQDRPSLPIIRSDTKPKVKEPPLPIEEVILPKEGSKSRRGSQDSRSSSAGNSRITAKLRPINDITLARSDNTILRQDIQICRERESQLLMRAMDLEDKIMKVASEDEASKKKIKVKPEVNINIDFGGDEARSGSSSKALPDKLQTVKVEIKDDKLKGDISLSLDGNKSKSTPDKAKNESTKETRPESTSKKNNAVESSKMPENTGNNVSKKPTKAKEKELKPPKPLEESSKSSAKEETKKSIPKANATKRDDKPGKHPKKPLPSKEPPPAKAKELEKSSVSPKPKELEKSSVSPKPLVESSKESSNAQDQKQQQQPKKEPHPQKPVPNKKPAALLVAADESQEANKVVKHDLFDGEDWRVTISSKHTLETVSQGPQSITISPKPPTPPPPPKVTVKRTEHKKEVKEKVVERKVAPKKEKGPPPSKADPIPKPSMFPVARPPRGHIPLPPQRTVPKNPYTSSSTLFPSQHETPAFPSGHLETTRALHPETLFSENHKISRDFGALEMAPPPLIRSSPDGANSLGTVESTMGGSEGGQDGGIESKDTPLPRAGKPKLKSKLKSPFKKLGHSLDTRLRLSKKSKSTSQLNQEVLLEQSRPKLNRSHHSVERLPTLSAFDEERVIWLKSFEDDITYAQERKKMQSLKEVSPPESSSPNSSGCEGPHNLSRKTPLEKGESDSSSDKEFEEIKKNLKRKQKRDRKPSTKPLIAECFIISRGWQMDQSRLIRALDRIKCTSFSRVQVANTVNRMVENLRPHQDVVVLHIGSQELLEASYGADDVSSLANSVSSVIAKHVANAAAMNRNTQFLVSLPLPRSSPTGDSRFAELRKSFNASLSSNLLNSINVQCIDNENLAAEHGEPEPKYYSDDNVQLSSKGLRKLAKNWEEFLVRITKTKDGNIFVRRASDSSSSGSAKENSRKL